MILERHIQLINPGKWAELEDLDKKYNTVESRLGFPTKKRYRCYLGGHTINTLIIERPWESMAAMEATYGKAFEDPEYQALDVESASIVESVQAELYVPMP